MSTTDQSVQSEPSGLFPESFFVKSQQPDFNDPSLLAAIARDANRMHLEYLGLIRDSLLKARQVGNRLNEAFIEVKRQGLNWTTWVEKNLKFSYTQSWRYRLIATNWPLLVDEVRRRPSMDLDTAVNWSKKPRDPNLLKLKEDANTPPGKTSQKRTINGWKMRTKRELRLATKRRRAQTKELLKDIEDWLKRRPSADILFLTEPSTRDIWREVLDDLEIRMSESPLEERYQQYVEQLTDEEERQASEEE